MRTAEEMTLAWEEHLQAQQGKSVRRLAREYRHYTHRDNPTISLDSSPAKMTEAMIRMDVLGPLDEWTPKRRKEYRDAYRHLVKGTTPLMPTQFKLEDTPIFLVVFARLMEISRDGTLLVDDDGDA
jgi:hypothetical protein